MQYFRTINLNTIKANLATGKAALLYSSAICFLIMVSIISLSVGRFIKDTMSISLIAPNAAGMVGSLQDTQTTDEVIVKAGDTLSKILYAQEIPVLEIQSILESIKKVNPGLTLNIGQRITFDYDISVSEDVEEDLVVETPILRKMVVTLERASFIEVARSDSGFTVNQLQIPLKKTLIRSSAVVKTSFVDAARSLGISNTNVNDLVNIYSHRIDFQRQVQPNDMLDLMLEKYVTEEGEFSHYGKVVFASLTLSGKPHNIYRYAHDGTDNMQYFSEDGSSVKRNLLRTPVAVARLSSKFGKRHHPVDGYTKMHKGVDFAAAHGTPIYSAGNGTVKHIGWKQGYGKCVEIRHSATLSTFYAHASAFAKGLVHGSTVKQGQTIAFVGATGKATGAHLHYEVKINGQQVNPLSIKTSPGVELAGAKLDAFKSYQRKIHKMHKELYTKSELAMVNDKETNS
jgi:murein DD-endopeptidase MepM/ murein hydrolase activator NlpD